MANEQGRPAYTDEQYQLWLDAMKPFLENSNSLYYSLVQAGLLTHQTTIYEKYRLKDWFAQKIDRLRAMPGELVNDGIVSLIRTTVDKIKRKEVISHDESDMLKFYAEKSRVAQPFFVNRTETASGKSVEEVLDEIEKKNETNNNVAEEAKKALEKQNATQQTQGQVVADQQSLPNQEQAGGASNIPAESNATSVQS